MSPERRGTTAFKSAQNQLLLERQRARRPERIAVGARDVTDLHAPLFTRAIGADS